MSLTSFTRFSRLRSLALAVVAAGALAGCGPTNPFSGKGIEESFKVPVGHQLVQAQWNGNVVWATLFEPAVSRCYMGFFLKDRSFTKRIEFTDCVPAQAMPMLAPSAAPAHVPGRGVGTSFVASLGVVR